MSHDSKRRDDAVSGDRLTELQKERQVVSKALKAFTEILQLTKKSLKTSHTNNVNVCNTIHSLVFSLEGRACQEPEPSHVTGMALAHCNLGKFLGVVCNFFPPPLDVPTLAARCLRPQRSERS